MGWGLVGEVEIWSGVLEKILSSRMSYYLFILKLQAKFTHTEPIFYCSDNNWRNKVT